MTLANDYIETVVSEVQCLSGPLNAIADDGDRLILQYFLGFLQRKFFSGGYVFFCTTKIEFCHDMRIFLVFKMQAQK